VGRGALGPQVFVQVVGWKRFHFFAPEETPLLYLFPRVHPLWHKSAVDFCHPDLERYPAYQLATPTVVDVGPGDLLYIPPYVWHRVETLSNVSVSLSTLSHDEALRASMEHIYKMDHKFDRLASPRGQLFALRLYVDMIVNEMVGYRRTRAFLRELLAERYAGLSHLFEDDPSLCAAAQPGIPTAQHVYGDVVTDMRLVVAGFVTLPSPEVRDLLFKDYLEELSAQVVGATRVWSFFTYCFEEHLEYYLTELGSEEHLDLWEYKELDQDEADNFERLTLAAGS
jgi:hypothetical protein